jgi:hypothetical protein
MKICQGSTCFMMARIDTPRMSELLWATMMNPCRNLGGVPWDLAMSTYEGGRGMDSVADLRGPAPTQYSVC